VLYLRTLGALRLDHPASSAGSAVHQRRPLTLLAYLAAAGDTGVSREQLLAVFWPETDVESARGALKQHVFALRKATGQSDVILGRDQLRLNPNVIQTDIQDFVAAARSGRTEDLLELYRGPFLDGVQGSAAFDAWVGRERRRYADMFEAALDQRVIELGAGSEAEPDAPLGPTVVRQRQRADGLLALRYATVGALCGVLAMVAGFVAFKPAPKYGSISEVFEARFLAHKNDKRPRGRLFIQTPIDQTERPDLSSVRPRIDGILREISGGVGDVVLVPKDSVLAIERAVSAQPGWQSAADLLRRANSPINVMAVYSIRGDSMRISVTLQRAVFPSASRSALSWWHPISSKQKKPFAGIETWTVASYMTVIERPNLGLAARALVRALRAMRSCKLSDHIEYELTPWCWRRDNQIELIPGYFDVPHPRTPNPPLPQ